jgi:hypothetical protein
MLTSSKSSPSSRVAIARSIIDSRLSFDLGGRELRLASRWVWLRNSNSVMVTERKPEGVY